MPTVSDLEVTRGVRRLLVKHWIDLGRISVRTTRGNVYLYGNLRRLADHDIQLSPRALENMFQEMARIKGANRINPHFENWICDSVTWRKREGE